MAVTLKEETVLEQWGQLTPGAEDHAHDVLEEMQSNLREAGIPGNCTWKVEEVQAKEGLFSKTKREFLIVRLEQFKDYRFYVAARAYGKYLDTCWFLTVEPGFMKKMFAGKVADGNWAALSVPKNVLLEQDLSSWRGVVHDCVTRAVESLFDRLGRPKDQISRKTQGILARAA